MLHAGLDLSRRKLDVCLLSDHGEHLDQLVVPPDVESLRRLARRIDEVHAEPVCAVVESMTGARLVHDTLERGLGGRDRRRPEGQGPCALGLQDRQDRLARPRDPLPSRPGAGDLAPGSRGPRSARARPLSHPSGQAQVGAQEPDPLDADQLRPALPGHRPVRGRGQKAPGAARRPRALALERRCFDRADRPSRGPDRSDQPPASGRSRRPSLHPAAHERPRDPLGAWRSRSPPRSARSSASHAPRS